MSLAHNHLTVPCRHTGGHVPVAAAAGVNVIGDHLDAGIPRLLEDGRDGVGIKGRNADGVHAGRDVGIDELDLLVNLGGGGAVIDEVDAQLPGGGNGALLPGHIEFVADGLGDHDDGGLVALRGLVSPGGRFSLRALGALGFLYFLGSGAPTRAKA